MNPSDFGQIRSYFATDRKGRFTDIGKAAFSHQAMNGLAFDLGKADLVGTIGSAAPPRIGDR
jgi:hypothetical protein